MEFGETHVTSALLLRRVRTKINSLATHFVKVRPVNDEKSLEIVKYPSHPNPTDTMTETDTKPKVEETEVKKGEATDATSVAKIIRQIEHYFGDFNLPRDKFLLEQIKDSEDGW